MTSLFETVELAPRDPILGLNEQYNADERSGKVNLGVGVYYDDQGRIPILQAVQKAEEAMMSKAAARSYLPIEGINTYNLGAQTLLLGADSPIIAEGRALTVQSLGGTGALKIGADFLQQLLPQSEVYISDPSWENHRALFERAGFRLAGWSWGMWDWDWWRDPKADRLTAKLVKKASPGDIVVIHDGHHKNPRADRKHAGETVTRIAPLLRAKGYQFGTLCRVSGSHPPARATGGEA